LGQELDVMIMSGVDDGTLLKCSADEGDGRRSYGRWVINIGRHDSNDICLNNDTFVSRYHAKLHISDQEYLLEDCESTNGTYLEATIFEDEQVVGTIKLEPGQLFRIGRTWLRIEPF
jgi:pSer/pThr/pTyr-binding forkhead associated (FHA) protein